MMDYLTQVHLESLKADRNKLTSGRDLVMGIRLQKSIVCFEKWGKSVVCYQSG